MHAVTDRPYLKLQNRFRGLVAEFNSHKFVQERRVPPSRQFRSDFADLLLDARATLQTSQYRPFIEWITEQSGAQLRGLIHSSAGFDELSGIYGNASVVSIDRELRWLTERFRVEHERITTFRLAAGEIERLILTGQFEEAIHGLEIAQEAFGASLWLVQLRIAAEHQAGGLERQKRYAAEVRGIHKRGLLNFVTYHTSVRNEDKTTFTKFLDDIDVRIDRHQRYTDPVRTYARYRLMDKYPSSEADLASILRIEQSHSIFDVYETFIAIIQEICRRRDSADTASTICECLREIPVKDFRLEKASFILSSGSIPPKLPARAHDVSDVLFSGQARKAATVARKYLHDAEAPDPWQFVYAGFALAHTCRLRRPDWNRPTAFSQMLGKILSRCDGSADAWAQLAKTSLNFRGLPVAAGVLDSLKQLRRTSPMAPWQPWLIGLNSPTFGVEDYVYGQKANQPSLGEASVGATKQVWAHAQRAEASSDESDRPIVVFAKSIGLIGNQKFDLAATALESVTSAWPEPLRNLRALALLHCYSARGDRQKAIEIIADEGTRGAAHRRFLPIVPTLKDFQWEDFKLVTQPLAAPIALHLLWSATENDATASLLRFATGKMLRDSGVARPSDLPGHSSRFPQHQLIYFLRWICVPNVLDVSRILSSSRQVMEERQAICAALCELDPQNANDYQTEIVLISNQLALDDGQRIVDRTRVHVDIDAFTRWALRELSEDFERYRDLCGVDVGGPQSFDDVLKEIDEVKAVARTQFIPDNEADAVLLSILQRLADEFLTNASFGLDFYLSKRIRHQSFIGLIRGPLEFSQLITTKESESGNYRRNDFWLEKFKNTSHSKKVEIDSALRECAAVFDDTLLDAKDTKFHLRSVERPDGLLMIPLDAQTVLFARAMIRMDFSFTEFLRTVYQLLWIALDPSLGQVREFIAVDIKTRLIAGFDALRASVREAAEHDPALIEFDYEVGRGSAEVQVKLDEAAGWFKHVDQEAQRRLFTLEQVVNIATDTALKCHRGFAPEITHEIEGDLQLTASSLVFVHDVIFCGLGNAQKHSGMRNPKIDIRARWNEAGSSLTIEIENEGKLSARADNEKKADAIREIIDNGSLGVRTRNEGGSGFLKIAAVVAQSAKGSIDFGYNKKGRFLLSVTYALLMEQHESAADE